MQKIFVAAGGSPIKESGLGSQLQDVSTCSVHHFMQAFYFLSLCYFFFYVRNSLVLERITSQGVNILLM